MRGISGRRWRYGDISSMEEQWVRRWNLFRKCSFVLQLLCMGPRHLLLLLYTTILCPGWMSMCLVYLMPSDTTFHIDRAWTAPSHPMDTVHMHSWYIRAYDIGSPLGKIKNLVTSIHTIVETNPLIWIPTKLPSHTVTAEPMQSAEVLVVFTYTAPCLVRYTCRYSRADLPSFSPP